MPFRLLIVSLVGLTPLCSGCAFYRNFHVVDSGELYRSAQLSADALRETVQEHGIQSVINLRGEGPGKEWFDEEVAICKELGVEHFSVNTSSRRLPHREELIDLLDLLRNAPRPMLVHCLGGEDRTGLFCALYAMEVLGYTKEDAETLLGPAASKRYFLEIYQGERWAREVYDPCAQEYRFYDRAVYCRGFRPRAQ